MKKLFLVIIILFSIVCISSIGTTNKITYSTDRKYKEAIDKTKKMVSDSEAQKLALEHNLNILNVTWEDTGRYKNSAVGPNISDMTIQVGYKDPRTKQFSIHLMPVIRYPNFSDISADLDPKDFTILVGNHNNKKLKRISLYDFLKEPTAFLSNPKSWKGINKFTSYVGCVPRTHR